MTLLTHMTTLLAAASLIAAPGCGSPTVVVESGGAGATGDDTGVTDGGGTDDDTASGTSGSSDAGDTEDTQGGGDTTDDGVLDDDGGSQEWCDIWAQDCPEGEKCAPVASAPGGAWDEWRCVPVGTEAPGSTCVQVDESVGADSCDATSVCYGVTPETPEGICVEFCVGTVDNATCPQTGNICSLSATGPPLCLPMCSPIQPDTCPPGELCFAFFEGDILSSFICFAPAAEGAAGEPCECPNCCAAGLLCADANDYGPGCAGAACCTEYCDLTDTAFTCAGEGQQCVALFEPTNPHFANVGACMVP